MCGVVRWFCVRRRLPSGHAGVSQNQMIPYGKNYFSEIFGLHFALQDVVFFVGNEWSGMCGMNGTGLLGKNFL